MIEIYKNSLFKKLRLRFRHKRHKRPTKPKPKSKSKKEIEKELEKLRQQEKKDTFERNFRAEIRQDIYGKNEVIPKHPEMPIIELPIDPKYIRLLKQQNKKHSNLYK